MVATGYAVRGILRLQGGVSGGSEGEWLMTSVGTKPVFLSY